MVARVTAQAELRGSLWPRTRNDLKVSRFLKGSPTPDSVLSVMTFGGGNMVVTDVLHLRSGSIWLLFLSRCPEDSLWLPTTVDEPNARIEGDSAWIGFDHRAVSTASLLDSVQTLLEPTKPRSLWAAAEGVLSARVERIPDRPRKKDEEWVSVTIRSIFKGARELRRKPGDVLWVRYRPLGREDWWSERPVAPILASREAVLFLQRIGHDWGLLPTRYSEWRISGDSVYVETSPPCCRGQKVIVQRLPWPAVAEELSR